MIVWRNARLRGACACFLRMHEAGTAHTVPVEFLGMAERRRQLAHKRKMLSLASSDP
jgi:hypothetical protein